MLTSASETGTVRIYDANIGVILHKLESSINEIVSVHFSRDDNKLAAASK